jgi:hypothetical protein
MATQAADRAGATRVTGRGWRTIRLGSGPEWSVAQFALAALSSLGVAIFVMCLHQAASGSMGTWWFEALLPLVLIGYAGSALPLALWALLIWSWFVNVPTDSFTLWSVPAAAGIALAHAATALLAACPPGATFPRATLASWSRGLLVAIGAAGVVAGLATAARNASLEAGSAAYVVGLLGVGLGVLWLRGAPVEPPE